MLWRILAYPLQLALLIGAPSGCMLSLQLYDQPTSPVTQETGTILPDGDVFLTASSSVTAGDCATVLVEMKDSEGNFVPAPEASTFSLSITAGAQVFSDNTCATPIVSLPWAQNQSFANVWIKKTSTGASTLTLVDDGSHYTTRNHNLTVDPGTASQLAFLSQPANSAAGGTLNASLQVEIQDAFGNRVTADNSAVTVSIQTNPGSSTLGGTATVNASSGLATFTNLWLNKTGDDYVLRATRGALTADTQTFDVSPAAATRLGFLNQPTTQVAGATWGSAIQIAVQDTYGNTVPTANDSISLWWVNSNDQEQPSSGTWGGVTSTVSMASNPAATSAGVSSFSSMSITRAYQGYLYARSSSGYTAIRSNSFSISAISGPTASQISGPVAVLPGLCSSVYSFRAVDVYGNSAGVSGGRTINLAGAGAGAFYSDSNCSTPITSVSMTNGSGISSSFYYKTAATSGSLTFSATDTHGTPLPMATLTVEVSPLQKLSIGSKMMCGLTQSGAAFCWGGSGALGYTYATESRTNPLPVHGLETGVSDISVGDNHICAIKSGAAYCWGDVDSGRLGIGTNHQGMRLFPSPVVGLSSGVTRISAGYANTCAIKDGGAYCWGRGSLGVNGDGGSANQFAPVAVTGLGTNVTDIDTQDNVACAIQSGGVYCWGQQENGGLGNGQTSAATLSSPVAVSGLGAGMTKVRVGRSGESGSHVACALSSAGSLSCWGRNQIGQVGNGTTNVASTPVLVSGMGANVTDFEVGGAHTCAVQSGALYCWGSNIYGALGTGDTANSLTPAAVVDTAFTGTLSGLSAGRTMTATCALNDGLPVCWGSPNPSGIFNASGIPAVNKLTPAASALAGVTSMTALSGTRCATIGGAVQCWGGNYYLLMGLNYARSSLLPVTLTGMTSGYTEKLVGGYYHLCALKSGQIFCRGYNSDGQLGNQTTSNIGFTGNPTAVHGLSAVTDLTSSNWNVCAIDSGAAYCWGKNNIGQLGNGNTTNQTQPALVTGLSSGVTSISSASGHSSGAGSATATTCVAHNGAAKCWGHNHFGTIGDGTTTTRTAPTQVTGLTSGVTQVAVGYTHACAIQSGGVKCWGENGSGQLGNGTFTSSTTPVQVSGLTSGVVEIAISGSVSCARLSTGAARCWGNNGTGQLGIGSTTHSNVPVEPTGMNSGVTGLLCSSSYGTGFMAFFKSGTLHGTGADSFGDPALLPVSLAPSGWDLSF